MLHRVLLVGVLAGLAAGVALTAAQLAWTVPLILDAEVYEHFGGQLPAGGFDAARVELETNHHDHGGEGLTRHFLTLMANMLFGVGAGLVIAGLFSLLRLDGWRQGLVWGAAAFVAVSLAPAVGLPPELPGTAAADLGSRQAWWLGTVAATAAAIAW